MELLLNLAWLLLALPAYWLWRGRNHAHARKFSALHFLLALGCMLVILFPVISATDDLCAMRAEFEESPVGKHSLRQTTHERPSAYNWHTHPALAAAQNFCFAQDWARLSHPTESRLITVPRATLLPARAPPLSLLA